MRWRWQYRLGGGFLALTLMGCAAGGVPSAPARDAAPRPAEAAAPTAALAGSERPSANPQARSVTPERITFALPAVSGVFAAHVVARDSGFLAEEGFDVEMPVMRSNLLASGMASGEVDYAGSFTPSIRNALAGQPIRVLAATVPRSTRQIVTAPGITSMEQLRGKVVALTAIGDGPHNSGILAFAAYGIDPTTEVTWIATGPGIERFAAVQQGIAQAVILTGAEIFRAEAMGLVPLLKLDEVAPLPESGVATSTAKLANDPAQVRRLLRAMVRALQYVKADRAGSVPAIARYLGVSPEEAAQAHEAIVAALSEDGTLSARTMQYALDAERKQLGIAADVPVSAVADFGPLYEALAELGITPAADAVR